MFSQTILTSRRQFIERSMLGAGSLLFSSSILQSCTDHRIPDPELTELPVGIIKLDWKDLARRSIIFGIEKIPEVGEILGPLVETFWPASGENVWDKVRTQTEAAIDKKIADDVYKTVSEDLQGLNNTIILFQNELKNGTPAEILTQWQSTRTVFVDALPHFMPNRDTQQGRDLSVQLLGLFAQFANLYLSLLRDGVISGISWGRTAADHQQDIADLKKAINDYKNHVKSTYENGLDAVTRATQTDPSQCEPFRSINAYTRQMTLLVLDFKENWDYYDVTQYPTGTKAVLTREIYSDPYGSWVDSGPVVIASTVPTQLPTQIIIWAGDRVDAVQLTYPSGSGPGGLTQTPRMGGGGGSNNPPLGEVLSNPPTNLINQFQIVTQSNALDSKTKELVNPIVSSFQLAYTDNTPTRKYGGKNNAKYQMTGDWTGYPDEAVSSIYIPGAASGWNTANCIVLGFKYYNSSEAAMGALRRFYITSPKEWSLNDLIKAFPNLAISVTLINDELKAARQAYWAAVKAKAEALK